jgi:tripartite-type tricarboxylate transporter receptor subunit TctC
MKTFFILITITLVWPCAVYGQGSAESAYPAKPVTVVAPSSPGAGFEIHGRVYLQKLSESMQRQFILDFRPGAGQTLGTANVAKAAPDGYMLLFTSATHTVAALVYKDLSYDPIKDFVPITLMTSQPITLIVSATTPVNSVTEYINYARANPGKVNMATGGLGSLSHFAGAWLHYLTKTEVSFIPYKGAGDLLIALIGGQVQSGTATLASTLPHVKAGRLRLLGITSRNRTPFMPDLPTVAEQGVPGYEYVQWQGFLAPAGTPPAIVRKLNAELVKVAKNPEVIQKVAQVGDQTVGSTPEEFGVTLVNEVNRWRKLVEDTKLKIE